MGRMTLPSNVDGVEFRPGDWIAVHDSVAMVLGVSETELFYRTDGPITSMDAAFAKPANPPKGGRDD